MTTRNTTTEAPAGQNGGQGHTPGPWHRNIRCDGKYPTVFAGHNTHVATARQMPNPAETEANIDLIAAAPELLAALAEIAEAYSQERFPDGEPERIDPSSPLSVARAAIAKATGR